MRLLRRTGAALLTLIVLVALYYASYLVLRGPRPAAPQLIAHRGGATGAPEGTLAAFRQAIALGVDWLEFDVQLSSDGVPVVFHDETVDRTTDGTGRVADLSLEELRRLDAGQGEQIPTFAEVLALAGEQGMAVLPEAKLPRLHPGLEAAMAEAVRAAGAVDRTVVQSFDAGALDQFRTTIPELGLCPLYGLWVLRLPAELPGGATYVCPMAEMVLLNPWMVSRAQQRGWKVYAWFGFAESPLAMRALLALGVDGLMVDDVATLAAILGR